VFVLELIDSYTKTELSVLLLSLGAPRDAVRRIRDDVATRLRSVLSLSPEIRQTILFLGLEEALFYEPKTADLDLKCLVVVAVRDSELENVASVEGVAPDLGTNLVMKTVTTVAINTFQKGDLFSTLTTPPQLNTYAHLPSTYPLAWEAVTHLSRLSETSIESHYDTPSGNPQPAAFDFSDRGEVGMVKTIKSGMDPSIDELSDLLASVAKGEMEFFFTDSFKTITRNPDKLLYIIEFLLSHQKALVTNNFYISPGYVSRRPKLLRPVNLEKKGSKMKLGSASDLSKEHATAMKWIAKHL
jgi:hypothetical protein